MYESHGQVSTYFLPCSVYKSQHHASITDAISTLSMLRPLHFCHLKFILSGQAQSFPQLYFIFAFSVNAEDVLVKLDEAPKYIKKNPEGSLINHLTRARKKSDLASLLLPFVYFMLLGILCLFPKMSKIPPKEIHLNFRFTNRK